MAKRLLWLKVPGTGTRGNYTNPFTGNLCTNISEIITENRVLSWNLIFPSPPLCGHCGKEVTHDTARLVGCQFLVKSFSGKITCSASCTASLKNMDRHAKNPDGLKKLIHSGSAWSRGKTLDQLYDDPENQREKIGAPCRGDNNPKWGKNRRTPEEIEISRRRVCETFGANAKSWRGKTLTEIHGPEKAAMILNKKPDMSGKNNPMYGKPPSRKAGNGWKGWYHKKFFRSLHELSFMVRCDKIGVVYQSAERVGFGVPYTGYEGEDRIYYPDFYLPTTDEVIEVKPEKAETWKCNIRKFEAARLQFPRFRLVTDAPLGYADVKVLIESGEIKLDKRTLEKYQNFSP